MFTAVVFAAVFGGGVLLILRRLFPPQKTVQFLRYPPGAMRGKTVIITGANSGIGKALAGELLKLQARVIMACRDQRSAEEAAQEIKGQAGPEQGEVVIKHLDLASLGSVRKFCDEIRQVQTESFWETHKSSESEVIFITDGLYFTSHSCDVKLKLLVYQSNVQ